MSQLLFKSGSFSVFNPQKTIMKMLKLTLILILPLLFIFSCTEKTKNVKEIDALNVTVTTDTFPEGAFIVGTGNSMLFLSPTPDSMILAVEQIKTEYGEDGLTEIGSDEGLYISEAKDFGVLKGLKYYTTNSENIAFKKENGSFFVLKNTISGIGGDIYLFDGKKEPKRVEHTVMFSDGNEMEAYFGKEFVKNTATSISKIQGKWATESLPDMHTETYRGDKVTIMPNKQYSVKLKGDYLIYSPVKNAEKGFKRKIIKLNDNEFSFLEENGEEIKKLIRPIKPK
jgi:hypothetical protein